MLWFAVIFTDTITECYINTLFTGVSLSLKSEFIPIEHGNYLFGGNISPYLCTSKSNYIDTIEEK